jgi:hypothetical protein
MKILEFINNYNEGKIEKLKEALEIKDYVPFAEKYELCASVLDACNDKDERTGMVTIDSINRQITFAITILSAYTNLEFSLDENAEISSIDEYDMLCKNKVLKPIIELFNDEYVECEEMLMIMQNDLIANSNTLQNIIGNVAKQLLNMVEPLGDVLKDKLGSFDLDLSQDNIDKFAKIFEGLNK